MGYITFHVAYFDLGEKKLVIADGEVFFALFESDDDDVEGVGEKWSPVKSDSIALSMSPLLFSKASLDT